MIGGGSLGDKAGEAYFLEAEKHLSETVVSKALIARIDTPSGIICFQMGKYSKELEKRSWRSF
ncbi:hypothetical protein IGI04_024012 [Brassica rapa subsp. trilocularis]|uniref:Uncharacterized protein n=1 Tax=Brassica rapa subsp. trilocularis TaxID=1813537 RepID=A0ABQ7M8W8_BRACM|nr:hypothetical protein IGI04_024012 [Brassica rapa subsp. trilocularis]